MQLESIYFHRTRERYVINGTQILHFKRGRLLEVITFHNQNAFKRYLLNLQLKRH